MKTTTRTNNESRQKGRTNRHARRHGDLTLHPYALLFPDMTESEFADLKSSIKRNGLREPITLIGNQVLDGRHRLRACRELGIEAMVAEWDGAGSALQFVIDQ